MRTTMLLVAFASLAACKWTEFDDIQGTTWVDSTEKPNVKSSDWGVIIERGAATSESASSGTLAVIGAGPGTYSELAYSAAGSASLPTTSLTLGNLGIMTLDSPPIFLASPTSSEVALVTTGDNGSIVVAVGTHTLVVHQLFVGNTNLGAVAISTTPDAATYVRPPVDPRFPGSADREPLVAAGDVVMGTVYNLPTGTAQPACRLNDGSATAIRIRALGAIPNGTTDDALVWNGVTNMLLRYPASVFNGCMTQGPIASTLSTVGPTRFTPGRGSQILPIDSTFVLLQGHQDITMGNAGFLQVFNATTLMPVGPQVAKDGIRSAAILTTAGGQYVVAGFPNETIDGQTAGVVRVFKFDTTSGLSDTPVATLHDAQPDNNQLFGRGVAVMPFNGKQVIAVAADNEIFVYFQVKATDGTNGTLYDETRQGR
ncbi:MAG TPA: hypothetical protein VF469_36925 [Kofleriaceae bacterium]